MSMPLWLLRIRRPIQVCVAVLLLCIPWLNSQGIHVVMGNLYALYVAGVPFADPLTIPQISLTGGMPGWKIWVGAAMALALALLQGRIFCGWLCPYGLLSELIFSLRGKKPCREKHPRYTWIIRALLTIIGLIAAVVCTQPLLNAISAPGILSFLPQLAVHEYMAILIAAAPIILVLLVEAISGQRLWCRYACPQALLLMAAAYCGKWGFAVRWQSKACSCGAGGHPCIDHCSMGLQPRHIHGPDRALCTQCGDCVRTCAKHGKALSIGLPK